MPKLKTSSKSSTKANNVNNDSILITMKIASHMSNATTSSITRWAQQGNFEKPKNGYVDLETFLNFTLHRDAIGAVAQREEISDEDIRRNKALLEKAKADVAETEVDIQKKRLVDKRDVTGYTVNLLTIFKRELLGLARNMPSYLYGLNTKEIEKELVKHLHKILFKLLKDTELKAFMKYLSAL